MVRAARQYLQSIVANERIHLLLPLKKTLQSIVRTAVPSLFVCALPSGMSPAEVQSNVQARNDYRSGECKRVVNVGQEISAVMGREVSDPIRIIQEVIP